MADYNIYIHAIGTGGATNENPTTPWSQRSESAASSQTTSKSNGGSASGAGSNAASAIIRAAGYAQNPDSLISSAISNIAKAFPIVAAAFAVAKLGEVIIDNIYELSALETGDYSGQIRWNNTKNLSKVAFHPVSSIYENFKTERQWARQNERAKLQRDLLGDSVINSYTNRGV